MSNHYPEIESLNGKPTKLMVFLHGIGSDGNDLISLVPYMQSRLEEYHFISPHAPEPYDMAPFGRQWFSIQDRTPKVIMSLVQKNLPILQKQITLKQQDLNIDNSNTVIFGFSQGTMIGTYLTLIQDIPFKTMICCSGRLIPPTHPKNTNTPFCIIHGINDDIVDPGESKTLAKYCRKHHIDHKLLLIPNLAHSIDGQGIEYAIKFLCNIK